VKKEYNRAWAYRPPTIDDKGPLEVRSEEKED
jgi:hypothetical protein